MLNIKSDQIFQAMKNSRYFVLTLSFCRKNVFQIIINMLNLHYQKNLVNYGSIEK